MDNDIDIYADLPTINLNIEQNDQPCNCEELNKKLGLLTSELENLQKLKNNLENNLSSLLKTAKAEITRKNKMIDELRQRLDDTIFRRNRRNQSQDFSAHGTLNQHDVIKQHEDLSRMEQIESRSHQIEVYQDEDKNKKIQDNIDQTLTVFGERMHKRIEKIIKEEEKQKILLQLDGEKEIVEENNEENGSQSSVNNDNESESNFIPQNPGTETAYMKNSKKRTIEEDRAYGNKRFKIEDGKDETVSEKLHSHNCVAQYDVKDDFAQYEIKSNFAKFNDPLDMARSFKKDQADLIHKIVLEDTKQNRNSDEWKREEKSDSRRDYDNSRSKKGFVDNLWNYRNASTSNHVSEGPNNEYKNDYRYSPPRRHYSKSRNFHESLNSHRLRGRSTRTYRDRKHDDYEYSGRYRNDKLKKNYDSKEYDNNKLRYNSREYGDLRDRFKRLSSDVEDNGPYKYKKNKSRGIRESTPSISVQKPHERDKTVTTIDSRSSFSRNINTDSNIERKTKNESNIKLVDSSESTTTHVAMNLSNLEEGEILGSPEEKKKSSSICRNDKIVNNGAKIIENKMKDSANVSADNETNLQNNSASTKQKVADIKVSKTEVASRLPRANLEDNGRVMPTKSSGTNNATTDETTEERSYNNDDDDTCRTRSDKDSTNTRDAATIQEVRDNNISEDSCKSRADKRLKGATVESNCPIKIMDANNSTTKGANRIKKLSKSDAKSIKSAISKEKRNDPDIENAIKSIELNHFDDNNHKMESKESKASPVKPATEVRTVLINKRDIEDKAEAKRVQDTNEICNKVSDRSDIGMSRLCLSDHNYVRDPAVEPVTDADAVHESPDMTPDCQTVPQVTSSKETKAKEETMDGQSSSQTTAKTTTSSMVRNKKNQQTKGVVISRRRRAVMLSDSNASMTVLVNTNVAETPAADDHSHNEVDSASKPRLRATSSRSSAKTTCK